MNVGPVSCESCGRDTTNASRYCDVCSGEADLDESGSCRRRRGRARRATPGPIDPDTGLLGSASRYHGETDRDDL